MVNRDRIPEVKMPSAIGFRGDLKCHGRVLRAVLMRDTARMSIDVQFDDGLYTDKCCRLAIDSGTLLIKRGKTDDLTVPWGKLS